MTITVSTPEGQRDWTTFDTSRPTKGRVKGAAKAAAPKWAGFDAAHPAHPRVTVSPAKPHVVPTPHDAKDEAEEHALTQYHHEAEELPHGKVHTEARKMTDDEFREHRNHVDYEGVRHGSRHLLDSPFSTHNSEDRVNGIVGNYTPSRRALHEQIINEQLERAKTVPHDRRGIVTGGLGGAGKSTILRSNAKDPGSVAGKLGIKYDAYDEKGNGIGEPSNFITLNPDEVKGRMAELGMIPKIDELSPMESSTFVHEESSDITGEIARRMHAQGTNVIHDVTLNSHKSAKTRIDAMHQNGYHVSGAFVDVSTHQSLANAENRHRHGQDDFAMGKGYGGRYVPSDLIIHGDDPTGQYRSKNRAAFEEAKPLFDRTMTIDNEGHAGKLLDESGTDNTLAHINALVRDKQVAGANAHNAARLAGAIRADTTDITAQIAAYRNGDMSLDDLTDSLANRDYDEPSYLSTDPSNENDVEDAFADRYQPGTWGEVRAAHSDGLLEDDEFNHIADAAYEAHTSGKRDWAKFDAERPVKGKKSYLATLPTVSQLKGKYLAPFMKGSKSTASPPKVEPARTAFKRMPDGSLKFVGEGKGDPVKGTGSKQLKFPTGGYVPGKPFNPHLSYSKPPIQGPPSPLPHYEKVPGDRTFEYRRRDLFKEGIWEKSADPRFGGVMFNPKGEVMMREPANHYLGYHWTFAKGGADPGEDAAHAAQRETVEETGRMGAIVGHVPGSYGGTMKDSLNHYYLMHLAKGFHPDMLNGETQNHKWMSVDEAHKAIAQTTFKAGRDRDHAILNAAAIEHAKLGFPTMFSRNARFSVSLATRDWAKFDAMRVSEGAHKATGEALVSDTKEAHEAAQKAHETARAAMTQEAQDLEHEGHTQAIKIAANAAYAHGEAADLHGLAAVSGKDAQVNFDTIEKRIKAEDAIAAKELEALKEYRYKHGWVMLNPQPKEFKHKKIASGVSNYDPNSLRGKAFAKKKQQALDDAKKKNLTAEEAMVESNKHAEIAKNSHPYGTGQVNHEGLAAGYKQHADTIAGGGHSEPTMPEPITPALGNEKITVSKPASITPKTEDDLTGMTAIPGPHGYNPSQWYKDANGQEYLVKQSEDTLHAYNEVAMAKVYEQAGVPVPEVSLLTRKNGHETVVSKKLDVGLEPIGASKAGKPLDENVTPETQAAARKDFGIDALTSNWDTWGNPSGADGRNFFKGSDGKYYRIDLGGAGLSKGTGGFKMVNGQYAFKPETPWNDTNSLRESVPGKLAYGADDEHLTPEVAQELIDSLKQAQQLDLDKVNEAWGNAGIPEYVSKEWLATLKKRQAQIPEKIKELQDKAGITTATVSAPWSAADDPTGTKWVSKVSGNYYKKLPDGTLQGFKAGTDEPLGSPKPVGWDTTHLNPDLFEKVGPEKAPLDENDLLAQANLNGFDYNKQFDHAKAQSLKYPDNLDADSDLWEKKKAEAMAEQNSKAYAFNHATAAGIKSAKNELAGGPDETGYAPGSDEHDAFMFAYNDALGNGTDAEHAQKMFEMNMKDAQQSQGSVSQASYEGAASAWKKNAVRLAAKPTATVSPPQETKYLEGSPKFKAYTAAHDAAIEDAQQKNMAPYDAHLTAQAAQGAADQMPPGVAKAAMEGTAHGYDEHAAAKSAELTPKPVEGNPAGTTWTHHDGGLRYIKNADGTLTRTDTKSGESVTLTGDLAKAVESSLDSHAKQGPGTMDYYIKTGPGEAPSAPTVSSPDDLTPSILALNAMKTIKPGDSFGPYKVHLINEGGTSGNKWFVMSKKGDGQNYSVKVMPTDALADVIGNYEQKQNPTDVMSGAQVAEKAKQIELNPYSSGEAQEQWDKAHDFAKANASNIGTSQLKGTYDQIASTPVGTSVSGKTTEPGDNMHTAAGKAGLMAGYKNFATSAGVDTSGWQSAPVEGEPAGTQWVGKTAGDHYLKNPDGSITFTVAGGGNTSYSGKDAKDVEEALNSMPDEYTKSVVGSPNPPSVSSGRSEAYQAGYDAMTAKGTYYKTSQALVQLQNVLQGVKAKGTNPELEDNLRGQIAALKALGIDELPQGPTNHGVGGNNKQLFFNIPSWQNVNADKTLVSDIKPGDTIKTKPKVNQGVHNHVVLSKTKVKGNPTTSKLTTVDMYDGTLHTWKVDNGHELWSKANENDPSVGNTFMVKAPAVASTPVSSAPSYSAAPTPSAPAAPIFPSVSPPSNIADRVKAAQHFKNFGVTERIPEQHVVPDSQLMTYTAYGQGKQSAMQDGASMAHDEAMDHAQAALEQKEMHLHPSMQARMLGIAHGYQEAAQGAKDKEEATDRTSPTDLLASDAYKTARAAADQEAANGATSRSLFQKAGENGQLHDDLHQATAMAYQHVAQQVDQKENANPTIVIPGNTPDLTDEQVAHMKDWATQGDKTGLGHGGDLEQWAYDVGRAQGIQAGVNAADSTAADIEAEAVHHEELAKSAIGLMQRKEYGVAKGLHRVAAAKYAGDNAPTTTKVWDAPKPSVSYKPPGSASGHATKWGMSGVEVIPSFTHEDEVAVGKFTGPSRFGSSTSNPSEDTFYGALNRYLGGKSIGNTPSAQIAQHYLHMANEKSVWSKQVIERGTTGGEYSSGQLAAMEEALKQGKTVDLSFPMMSCTYSSSTWGGSQYKVRYFIDPGALTMDVGHLSGHSEAETNCGGLMEVYKIEHQGGKTLIRMRQVLPYVQ